MSKPGAGKDAHAVPPAAAATKRLELLNGHMQPKPKPRRQRKPKVSEPPADWSDVLAELDYIRKIAQTPRTETTGYIRHKEAGKLWVRERVEKLLDTGSFMEVGSAAGTTTWLKSKFPTSSVIEDEKETVGDFTPSNNVQGKKV